MKAIKAPNVRRRKKGGREYWAADWRKDGKSVTRHIGPVVSMSQDEASEIALQKKIKDLSEKNLQTSDFVFQREDETSEIKAFIEKNEWLGTASLYPTDVFSARYRGLLGGVVVFDMPVMFSELLGPNDPDDPEFEPLGVDFDGETYDLTKNVERLVARGASASWTPRNLASWHISRSIAWMIQNTRFRLFVGYADAQFDEVGVIYQSCNFYFLGLKFGAGDLYKVGPDRWVSSRHFRSRSTYKRLARDSGIVWKKDWQQGDNVIFDNMPKRIARKLKELSKNYQNSCERRKIAPKNKYAYVGGTSKKETRRLRERFEKLNKTFPYPKRITQLRGPAP